MKTFLKWLKWILIGTFVMGFMACVTLIMLAAASTNNTKDVQK